MTLDLSGTLAGLGILALVVIAIGVGVAAINRWEEKRENDKNAHA